MKIERLLAITVMLLNRRKVTAAELAEYFEVSSRTIYRDFDSLNHAGIPISSYQGYEGGYCIPDNFKLSRQLLTYDDMVSIITTLKGINTTLCNKEINGIIDKITTLIPSDKLDLYEKQLDQFIIDISPWNGPFLKKEIMGVVHRAVSDSRTLSFHYTTPMGEKSARCVEPHSLVFKSFSWYLLAFCRLRNDFRIFKLSRMDNPQLQPDHFVRKTIDPTHYFQPHFDSRPTVELVLHFHKKARMRVEEMFDKDQLTTLKDGTTRARFTIPEDNWITSFVLSFGDCVEIISPIEWRQKVHKEIQKMQKKYRTMT